MDRRDFEARYRTKIDPWGYTESPYERDKYADTLRACGAGPFASALELGASIGVFSALLAERCARLTTIDFAATAVAAARKRLAGAAHVRVLEGTIPDDLPDETFDLILASEILYYLEPQALAATLGRLELAAATGARIVAVHWRPQGPDRWHDAAAVHQALHAQAWLMPLRSGGTDAYRLDVWERA